MSLNDMLKPETLAAHRATWYVWAGGRRMRRQAAMRGTWGYDVECSCGAGSRTGGATKGTVEDWLFDHRHGAEVEAELHAEARAAGVDPDDQGAYLRFLREKLSEPSGRVAP